MSIVLNFPLRRCPGKTVESVSEISLGINDGEGFAVDLRIGSACVVASLWRYGGTYLGGIERCVVVDIGGIIDDRICVFGVVVDQF